MRKLKSNKGFTLIELLIVLAIIGILTGLLLANFIGVRQRARDAQRKSDTKQIQVALELYRQDNGNYPLSSNIIDYPASCGTGHSISKSGGSTYMLKIPCDPVSSKPYLFVSNNGQSYTLLACLENQLDQQCDNKDSNGNCQSAGPGGVCASGYAYTLTNP
jgi:type II secretion system protein G